MTTEWYSNNNVHPNLIFIHPRVPQLTNVLIFVHPRVPRVMNVLIFGYLRVPQPKLASFNNGIDSKA